MWLIRRETKRYKFVYGTQKFVILQPGASKLSGLKGHDCMQKGSGEPHLNQLVVASVQVSEKKSDAELIVFI